MQVRETACIVLTCPHAPRATIREGAVEVMLSERAAEARRKMNERMVEYLDLAGQGLPLFPRGADLPTSPSHEEAVEALRSYIYANPMSDAGFSLSTDGVFHDAQDGRDAVWTVTVSGEGSGVYPARDALRLLLAALRPSPTTPSHLARTVGQIFRTLLLPNGIKVAVKPLGAAQVKEVGTFAWKGDGDPQRFELKEEALRLYLSLAVPRKIEAWRKKGGPSDIELEGAEDAALELARKPEMLLDVERERLAELTAVASFAPAGIRLFGLDFRG
jgi:hypothetical protein